MSGDTGDVPQGKTVLDEVVATQVGLALGGDVPSIRDIADRLEQLDLLVARYALQPGSAYLIRPDQYVAGRWRFPTSDGVCAALDCARGGTC